MANQPMAFPSDLNGTSAQPAGNLPVAVDRFDQLLLENQNLREELDRVNRLWKCDREMLQALMLEDMPQSEDEWQEQLKSSPTLTDVLRSMSELVESKS